MTTLYLIRHGIAAERGTYANDDDRPLTEKGQRRTRLVAERLAEMIQVELILTSPLVRARQTAEILRDRGVGDRLEVSPPLAPGGSLQDWLLWLGQWHGGPLALVGHQPDLGNWAELLLWGRPHQRLEVKKAGVLGLRLPVNQPVGCSTLFWLTPPRLLI